jgi:RimJ/RimL family protein N-acetyltransferase
MEKTKEKIELNRITRRDIRWSDFDLIKEWRNSPHIFETFTEFARPLTDDEIELWIGSYIEDKKHEFGTFVIISVDGKPIGWEISRDFKSGIPEIGVAIADRSYWGSELILSIDRIGRERLRGFGFTKIRIRTRKDNARVLGLVSKVGYTKVFENDFEIAWILDL